MRLACLLVEAPAPHLLWLPLGRPSPIWRARTLVLATTFFALAFVSDWLPRLPACLGIVFMKGPDGSPMYELIATSLCLNALVEAHQGNPKAVWCAQDLHHLVASKILLIDENLGTALITNCLDV